MRVAPRYGLDDSGDFDGLSRIEDPRLTVVRVGNVPEHGETDDQAHYPEELSHVVISCRARFERLWQLGMDHLPGVQHGLAAERRETR